MADTEFVGIRIPSDWDAQIRARCQAAGITLSDFIRHAIANALGESDEAYVYGIARHLAMQLAFKSLEAANAQLPATYEEAVARFGIIPGVS